MRLPALLALAGPGCLAAILACGLQLHPQAGQAPPTFNPRIPSPNSVSSAPSSPQRACRNAIPRDWVAVDFMTTDDCPVNEQERYSGALVVRHTDLPRGTELRVCADQRLPRGWRRLRWTGEDALPEQCPSSGDTRPVSERVIRIEKL